MNEERSKQQMIQNHGVYPSHRKHTCSLNRRQFLKSAATGAAFAFAGGCARLVPPSTLGLGPHVAPSNRIVMGTIGIGWQGGNNLEGFLSKEDVQVVAVCDIDKSHLERAKRMVDETYGNTDCKTYHDFRDLIGRPDLDAVTIALPDHWHAIPAIESARAGLDIHGEKPLSHDLAEGRAMSDAVNRYNRVWQTGSWQRSVSNFHRACELVRNGRIGKVYKVEVGLLSGHTDYEGTKDKTAFGRPPDELDYDRWVGPAPWSPYCRARVHKNWRWVLDFGGGTIMDWVGHHVDIAHWGLGLDYTGPVEIEGTAKFPQEGVWDSPTEYRFTCKYANGLELIGDSSFPDGAKWYGDSGWLYVTRGVIDAHPRTVLNETIGPNEVRLYKSDDHLRNFLDCVKTRAETITPCEVAHRSASVGHLAMIAIRTGRKIKWNPEREQIIGDPGAASLLSRSYREPWTL